MVSAVVCKHYGIKLITLGKTGGDGEHNAVTERHYGAFHVFIGIRALRDVPAADEKVTLEILSHKLKRYHKMPYPKALAVEGRILKLTLVVLGAVVEGNRQRYAVLIFIKERGAVKASGIY